MRTILVVDDNDQMTRVVHRILTRNRFRVIATLSADEALKVIAREDIHLIISDVHMPRLPGPGLLAHLRTTGVHVPVVFMSGDLALENVEGSLRISGAAFLPKPFTPAELLNAVDAGLRASAHRDAPLAYLSHRLTRKGPE